VHRRPELKRTARATRLIDEGDLATAIQILAQSQMFPTGRTLRLCYRYGIFRSIPS
jgi:hypothetical protein